jgi:hypothetical protein
MADRRLSNQTIQINFPKTPLEGNRRGRGLAEKCCTKACLISTPFPSHLPKHTHTPKMKAYSPNAIDTDNLRIHGEFPSEFDAREVEEVISQIIDLLTVNWSQIKKVTEANGDKGTLALNVALDHGSPDKRIAQVTLGFSQKFKDQSELGIIDNPDQAQLPLD